MSFVVNRTWCPLVSSIYGLEGEMIGGPPSNSFSGPLKDLSIVHVDPSTVSGLPRSAHHNIPHRQPEKPSSMSNLL